MDSLLNVGIIYNFIKNKIPTKQLETFTGFGVTSLHGQLWFYILDIKNSPYYDEIISVLKQNKNSLCKMVNTDIQFIIGEYDTFTHNFSPHEKFLTFLKNIK